MAAFFVKGPDELSSVHERQSHYDVRRNPGALASDDARRFRRGTQVSRSGDPEWKMHAADLEAEMLKRGMIFEVIDWSEDQAEMPFEGLMCSRA